MTFRVFMNNQSVKQATLMPNGRNCSNTRYIFIEGRNEPIILMDEKSSMPQNRAVGVDDGKNKHYQLGYDDEGNIQITIEETKNAMRYTASSGYTTVDNLL